MPLWSRYTCGATRRVETRPKCHNWRDLLTAWSLNYAELARHGVQTSRCKEPICFFQALWKSQGNTRHSIDLDLLAQVFFSLQHLKRTGWVRRGVQEPETVASHMYRMAMMAFLFGDGGIDSSVDRVRCVDT